MMIRKATSDDWPGIYPIYAAVMAAGRTYPFPEKQAIDEARPWWMEEPPAQVVVAVDDGAIIGSAKMGPNRPARGGHIATASFIVEADRQGQGIGRRLGEYMLTWAKAEGYHGVQFNAVVETNHRAVHLWRSLGFTIIGTVPEAFDHPEHGLVGLHLMYQKL